MDAQQALLAGRALSRANDYGPALRAYDAHVRLVGGAAAAADDARLERALLLVRNRRPDDAIEEFRALSTGTPERIGAVALEAWADLRSEQGRTGDVQTLRGWLLERYPSSAEAADVLFFRGDAPHDRNEVDNAAAAYRRLIATAPGSDRAGLATMRVAQIHLLKGERARAAEIYEGYLASFPNGRRWQEASYWAARIRLALGDRAQAESLGLGFALGGVPCLR
jgi:TolA-binding protein